MTAYTHSNIHEILAYLGYRLDIDFDAEGEENGGIAIRWFVEPPLQSVVDAAAPLVAVAAIQRDLAAELEAHYDKTAQQRRYDNRLTCALRAGYAGPFQAEGQAFAIWMDNCNAYAYQVMADCLEGKRAIPTAAELISELPPIVWPV